MKTSELTGAAIDCAVAKAEGKDHIVRAFHKYVYEPSTNWAQGGPIIEAEEIAIRKSFDDERGDWTANIWSNNTTVFESGPTPLIAAMRCYVASKLGDDIEIPKELEHQNES